MRAIPNNPKSVSLPGALRRAAIRPAATRDTDFLLQGVNAMSSLEKRSNYIVSDGLSVLYEMPSDKPTTAYAATSGVQQRNAAARLFVECDKSVISVWAWAVVIGSADDNGANRVYFNEAKARRDCKAFNRVSGQYATVERRRMMLVAPANRDREMEKIREKHEEAQALTARTSQRRRKAGA